MIDRWLKTGCEDFAGDEAVHRSDADRKVRQCLMKRFELGLYSERGGKSDTESDMESL